MEGRWKVESDGVIAAKEFGMIAGCDSENAIKEGAVKIYNLITGADTEESSTGEFALMGVTFKRSTQMTLPPVILVSNLQSPSQMILPHVHQLPVTGKVPIPPARPQPVPTGKLKVFAPVLSGRQNRPFPVPTNRGYSPSTYTPYAPTISYTHIKYGGDRWATAVKPSAGCSWKSLRKGLYWENPFSAAKDEGIFNSGCSRSMTGNKERLDDFQEFHGGKVMFGGVEGRITGDNMNTNTGF
nr:ribonuclease H-like domain-containing protein [Tanacetum cinerariifolium]